MNCNGKIPSLAYLVEAHRDDQVLDVIGGNGHVECVENDPRIRLKRLFDLKGCIFRALEISKSRRINVELKHAKRLVLAALGETESE
jgi:hypothetical protein